MKRCLTRRRGDREGHASRELRSFAGLLSAPSRLRVSKLFSFCLPVQNKKTGHTHRPFRGQQVWPVVTVHIQSLTVLISRPRACPFCMRPSRFFGAVQGDRFFQQGNRVPQSYHIGISTSRCRTPGFRGWSQSGEDEFTHGGCHRLPAQAGQPFFQPGPFGPGFTPNSISPKA